MIKRKLASKIVERYKQAWIKRDPESILKIFTKNGTYHEYVLKKPFRGHEEIRKYWKEKVIGTQKNIKFKLLNLYIEDSVIIAESDIRFYETVRKITIHMREIMIMEIKGSKISNLREYWSSEHIKNKKIIPK